jgi:hypothetical protein
VDGSVVDAPGGARPDSPQDVGSVDVVAEADAGAPDALPPSDVTNVDGSFPDVSSCMSTVIDVEGVPVDVFIMQDKSGSMACPAVDDTCQNPIPPVTPPTRWDAMTTAINQFASSPAAAGVGVGIGFFPITNGISTSCTASAYATPVVPIAPLPGNALPISQAFAATMPGSGTPTTPALQGAIDYAKLYTVMQQGARTASVVFVTDGLPTGCTNNTVAAAAQIAKDGYEGAPRITTFVVGMGDTASLDLIALSGSGSAYHYIPTMGDIVGTVTSALNQITSMITCNYVFRGPQGMQLDPFLVNVQVKVGAGGAPQRLGKVDNAGACGSPGGWFYDNILNPTQVSLCPQSCDPLKTNPGSQVQVLYGCPSVVPPSR